MDWFWKLFGWFGKLGQLLQGMKALDAHSATADDYQAVFNALAADPGWPIWLARVRDQHGDEAVAAILLAGPYILWGIDYLAETAHPRT